MAVNNKVYLHIHSRIYSLKRVVPSLKEYPERPYIYSSDIAIIPTIFWNSSLSETSFGTYESTRKSKALCYIPTLF